MHLPTGLRTGSSQRLEKSLTILLIEEDRLAPVATVDHMIDRSLVLDPQRPGNFSLLSSCPAVSIASSDPLLPLRQVAINVNHPLLYWSNIRLTPIAEFSSPEKVKPYEVMIMMFRLRQPFVCMIALFFLLPGSQMFAQEAPLAIRIVTTFDYPGTGNSTTAHEINSGGDIVGTYLDSSGVTRGFVRLANGSFTAPIVDPNDTGNFTFSQGINRARLICGYYLNGGDFTFHGFFLSGRTYTPFDVASAVQTFLLGVNDAGDFAGSYDNGAGTIQAFVDIAGSVTSFSVAGSSVTHAQSLNATNQAVGEYYDASSNYHGYFRDTDGTLTFPLDFPGSTSTILNWINDRNLIVGKYVDSGGVEHGLLLKRPSTFLSFDYPGATGTSLNGINNQKFISGRYTDSSGIRHGFLAQASTH